MTIVRSIDLGYGYVKYTTRNPNGDNPSVVTRHLPALALPVFSTFAATEGSGLKQPQTVAVNVKEALYQVGPETPLLLTGQSGRHLDGDYSRSDQYVALMLGTLAYMGEQFIDVLILGLPISTYPKEKERLTNLFRGTVNVPMIGEADRTRRLEIRHVVVLPQPVGGYLDARASVAFADGGRGSTLVIDPGFYTFDWVVMSENSTYIANRSGAIHGGMSAILRMVADKLEENLGKQIIDLFPIDAALKSGEPLVLYGKPIHLDELRPNIEARCKTNVMEMIGRLGNSADLRRVVLCGGGARLFRKGVTEALPTWDIHLSKDPMFANVRGFQGFGEEYANRIAAIAV